MVPLGGSVPILFWEYFFFDWGFLPLPSKAHIRVRHGEGFYLSFCTFQTDIMISRSHRVLPSSWIDHSSTSSFVLDTDGASKGNPGSFTAGGLLGSSYKTFLTNFTHGFLEASVGSQTSWFSWFFWFLGTVWFPHTSNLLMGTTTLDARSCDSRYFAPHLEDSLHHYSCLQRIKYGFGLFG